MEIKEEGHPKGLYLLFFVEMWERFGYYGMRALLTLYMVKHLMFTTQKTGSIYGWFTGLVYLTPLLGGYIADRYMGQRKCIIVGAIMMAVGYFMLGASASVFYPALFIIMLGNGFFKPNISTIVGRLYPQNDPRRDGGFTIFYMGINVGALASPLIAGTLGEKLGWQYGFWSASLGMVIGLITYLWGQHKFLGDLGAAPSHNPKDSTYVDAPLTREDWHRIAVIFIMTFFAIFFWASFEQAGSSLTLFADKSTDRVIFGWTFPASWFQVVNPLFIVLLGIPFSKLWLWMARKDIEPTTPLKFVLGLTLLGAGFVLMIFAADINRSTGLPVSLFWLCGVYFVHTLGELCLSPVGLSMITKLAPVKFASLLMGTWFLSSAAANVVGGLFAGEYDAMDHALFFMIPTATALGSAFVLWLLSRQLNKWMHGVH